MTVPAAVIRPARPEDIETLITMIRELAKYEALEHEVRATPELLNLHLFGERPFAEAWIAEAEGEVAGFVLFFHTFSTWRGLPGIYLEDLYVRPAHRGLGLGKALLARLATLALERGCGRLEWAVLDWNAPAIGFYQAMGATPMDEWTVFRVEDSALETLAGQASI
ncbi:GNAT family N-acetyltransferase [Isosphaeraceae bacterium EP7]